MQKYIAEGLGTFSLVFAGTGAIVVNDLNSNVISHLGIAMVFGLTVMAMIYALGEVSGAHINPAVTIAFCCAKRLGVSQAASYVFAQLCGGFLASSLIRLLFPDHLELGATLPQGPLWRCFVMEVTLTAILMFVILNVSTGSKEKGIMAGAAIGGVVMLAAVMGGPVSGASMNPARSIAPAVVSGNLDGLWLYLVAPVLGAVAAVPLCMCVQNQNCCCAEPLSDPSNCRDSKSPKKE